MGLSASGFDAQGDNGPSLRCSNCSRSSSTIISEANIWIGYRKALDDKERCWPCLKPGYLLCLILQQVRLPVPAMKSLTRCLMLAIGCTCLASPIVEPRGYEKSAWRPIASEIYHANIAWNIGLHLGYRRPSGLSDTNHELQRRRAGFALRPGCPSKTLPRSREWIAD